MIALDTNIRYPLSSDQTFLLLGGDMTGKRLATMDIRELLRHLRETESDRAVQRATGFDRRTTINDFPFFTSEI